MASSIVCGNRRPQLSCALGERVYSWLHRPDVPWLGVEPNIPAPLLVHSLFCRTHLHPHDDGRSFKRREAHAAEGQISTGHIRRRKHRHTLTTTSFPHRRRRIFSITASSLLHTEYRETDIFLFRHHSTVVPPPWLTLRVKQEKNYVVSFQTEDGTVNHGCCIVITCCQLSVVLRGAGGPGRAPGEQEQRVAIQGASRGHLSTAGRLRNGV